MKRAEYEKQKRLPRRCWCPRSAFRLRSPDECERCSRSCVVYESRPTDKPVTTHHTVVKRIDYIGRIYTLHADDLTLWRGKSLFVIAITSKITSFQATSRTSFSIFSIKGSTLTTSCHVYKYTECVCGTSERANLIAESNRTGRYTLNRARLGSPASSVWIRPM